MSKVAKKVKKKVKKEVKKMKSKPKKKVQKRPFSVVRAGRMIGSYLGGTPGGNLGAEAGRLFRQVTGFGDYKVSRNTLLGGSDTLPTFRNGHNFTRVMHREYLQDVVTSSTIGQFKIESFPIQPGLLRTFPWLSAIAENYEEYTLNGMVFEFKSNSYDALSSTNTASGTVVMTTQYNPLNPPFTTKTQMEQYEFTCSSKPSVDLLHPVECARLETPTTVLSTRSAPVLTGDVRLYDWGNFYIATVGMQGASTNIGELWVTYDLTLMKPKMGPSTDVFDHYVLDVATAGAAGPDWFGAADTAIRTPNSDLGTTITPNSIVFPAGFTGNVSILYMMYSTGAPNTATPNVPHVLTYSGGASPLNVLSGLNTPSGVPPMQMVYNNPNGTQITWFVRVVNGGTVTISGGTNAAAAFAICHLVIAALPYSMD